MKDATPFNYAALDSEAQEPAQRHAEQIHALIKITTSSIAEIGRRLHQAKELMNDTRVWNRWVRSEFQWGQSIASNYMRIAEKFGHLDCLDNFQPTALAELTKDRVDPRSVKQAVKEAEAGETVTRKRARELATQYATAETPAPKPDALHHLKTALKQLSNNLDALLTTLQTDDVNALADDLLELAVKLRRAGSVVQPAPKRKPAKRTAARRTRKSSKSAA